MPALSDDLILDELRALLARRGRDGAIDADTSLEAIGFRSLDLSELALHVEERLGGELNFEAAGMRRIERVGDVVEFLRHAAP